MDELHFLETCWKTVSSGPTYFVIAAVLVVIGLLIESNQWISNKLIKVVYLVGGAVLYTLLADPKSVPVGQRNPMLLIAALGTLLGALAWLAHFLVIKAFNRFFPAGFIQADATNVGNQKPKE